MRSPGREQINFSGEQFIDEIAAGTGQDPIAIRLAHLGDNTDPYTSQSTAPRMRAVLEADVVYRGRQIAQSGVAAMLNGLSSRIEYDHGVVTVRLADPKDRTQAIDGNGLTLVPTMFTRRASAPVGDGPPMIMYSARGQGALWETERVANPAAVVAVLGETRASLLAALGDPASSTELGVRLGVTASAVNQHLRVLRDAGLLVSTRYGRSVLYLRSELGSALLEARAG
jgi:DNA-binding transcriptional ArsR family regulator